MPPDVVRTMKLMEEKESQHFIIAGEQFLLPKLSGWEEIGAPLLHVPDADVESGRDDAALVEPASQVDDNFAASVVVDDLELADVAVLHHDGEKSYNHLRRRPQENLALAALLCVIDGFEGRGQGVHQHHDAGLEDTRCEEFEQIRVKNSERFT